jgi:hypothetical protein
MSQRFVRDTLGWGFGLWLFGYVLGILLFPFVPVSIIGWVITPVGILVTLWVLLKKVKGNTLVYYLSIGTVWALIAIVCDYFFLVKVFKPADGYYKLDVYLYYILTFVIPALVGWKRIQRN